VLFMFDSCFSGSVFQRKRGGGRRSALIDYLATQDVRQFISSGTHRQEVPDRSVFARMFHEALAGPADLNGDGYITGTELGQYLRETVSNITRARQTPQFARMSKNGVDYGEFLFASPIGPHGKHQPAEPPPPQIPPAPGERFSHCAQCPEMIVIPAGAALTGSPRNENGRAADEPLPEQVQVTSPFALSVFEVTEREWAACFREGGCSRWIALSGGADDLPVSGVSWEDAREYTLWLSAKTGYDYRLPTAGEWEYAARAGSTSARPWGESIGNGQANCRGCGSPWDGRGVAPVGQFEANGFGLHDTMGNLWEWVRDCEQDAGRYHCLLKGGSYGTSPVSVRSAAVGRYPAGRAQANFGFRVLRQP
jgi:formylglycine-generating enzyme required for sulfatase activity